MSTLTLIRHGQATPFEDDPDQLSPLGRLQAHRLGCYWRDNKISFDEIYAGNLIRQQHTAGIVGQVFLDSGLAWPALQVMPEFDEYHVDAIFTKYIPKLIQQDPSIAGLFAAYQRDRDGPGRNRSFQRALEAVMGRWQEGTIAIDEVEKWTTFRDRVRDGLRKIMHQDRSSRRIAVYTSGGPIGVAIQTALASPDRSALEVNWRVRNCSATEFIFTQDRMTLDSFNTLYHLEDRSWWSYR